MKKDCPFFVKISTNSNSKLEITAINNEHKFHACDRTTFLHYNENMRLSKTEEETAKTLIQCGAKKMKMKTNFMGQREAPLSLKSLHNVQTKMNKSLLVDPNNELVSLLEHIKKIPGAKVKVAVDENNDLLGIYYQDERMAKLYQMYPELVIFDATYKLNDRRMPLFLMLIVDGAGESEVICFWIIKSENKQSVEAMFDAFKEFNENWEETKVVISK